MPEKATVQRARRKAREGKAPTTQAGEFVREEIHHVREGKHGARSAKQAIAIGLSKARSAGVKLPPPPGEDKPVRAPGRKSARPSGRRSRALRAALRKEPRSSASHRALARQATQSARKRPASARRRAAKKAAATRKRAAH